MLTFRRHDDDCVVIPKRDKFASRREYRCFRLVPSFQLIPIGDAGVPKLGKRILLSRILAPEPKTIDTRLHRLN